MRLAVAMSLLTKMGACGLSGASPLEMAVEEGERGRKICSRPSFPRRSWISLCRAPVEVSSGGQLVPRLRRQRPGRGSDGEGKGKGDGRDLDRYEGRQQAGRQGDAKGMQILKNPRFMA
ncbi:hypothetical protein GGR56DRAFT_640081 [Xylariaceae sp. FL0804]|nr:hypothetical protein GGR56DRAFT_640081 [Xylariaceae sp. FL0804]